MRVKEAIMDAVDEKMTEAEDEEQIKKVEDDEESNERRNIANTLFNYSNKDVDRNTANEAVICDKTLSNKRKMCEAFTPHEQSSEDKSIGPQSHKNFEDKKPAPNSSQQQGSTEHINVKKRCKKEESHQTFTCYEMMSEELDNTQCIDNNMVRPANEDYLKKNRTVEIENIVTHSSKVQKSSSNFDHTYCKSTDNKKNSSVTNDDINENMIKQTENEPYYKEHITTRRILDFPWIQHELHEAFDHNHKGSCQGLFRDLKLLRCTDRGLLTQMFWQCQKCFKSASIWSESQKSTNCMSLNESAVLGTLISGIGYTNLKEQLATMNIHIMTDKTYRKYRDKIECSITGTSQKEMDEAAEMEKNLAIEANDFIIHNGTKIPYITVIVDGAWSKRSYKNGRYDALSGFATIIGLRTGRVLYCGVRNKYCSVCAAASKNQKDPTIHKCYKNYARNDTSTSMESDIIVEGFKCSLESHGLIYKCFIGDGDSSVHQSIVNNNPYKEYDIEVQKIECKNHLFRNFCNHIVNASAIKIPASSVMNLTILRQSVKESARKMRKYVEKNVTDIKEKYNDREEQIKQLADILTNMPRHFFGDHSECTDKTIDDCQKIKENIIASLEIVGIYPIIIQIISRLSKHADSLLDNLTTNKVEGLNSIANKTLGGRRINYSQRNSFNLRVSVAVIQSDTQEVGTKINKFIGLEVPSEITKLEKSKQAQVLRTEKSRKNKGRSYRRFFGPDKSYGKVEEEDMPLYEYNLKEQKHFKKLKERQEKRDEIMNETKDQANSPTWHQYRRDIITASHFGSVCRRRETTSCSVLVTKIVYPTVINVSSLQFGREFEKTALKDLAKKLKIKPDEIEPCGLFIDKKLEFLGATPDGLIGEDSIVEVKCLESIKHLSPNEALQLKKPCMTKIFDLTTGKLKITHDYYYQVQGQLHITDRQYCYFTVWTPKGLKYEIIERDDKFWETKMEPQLNRFYNECVLPEIIDGRKTRGMKIREPTYILEAQKKAKAKNQSKTKLEVKSTPNENLDNNIVEASSTLITNLLCDITECTNLQEIEMIWHEQSELINTICNRIAESIENVTDSFQNPNNVKLSEYQLKTSKMSSTHADINHTLNNDFLLVNVFPDGNCLFRSIADIILCDEDKYIDIKVFIINTVLCNKTKYEPIIYYKGIPVSECEENNHSLFPTVDDFLRQIAREGEWGDHGSLYVLCSALKIDIIVIGVDKSTHNLININKYSPSITRSIIPVTIVNEVKHHFVAARRRLGSYKFDEPIWKNQKINLIKVDEMLSYYCNKYTNKITTILDKIYGSKSLQEIEEIVNDNHQLINHLCIFMQNMNVDNTLNSSNNNNDGDKVIMTFLPKECLDRFDIYDIEGDGNCFYRSIAKLWLNDQKNYPEIKLFIIYHILDYRHYYAAILEKNLITVAFNINGKIYVKQNPTIKDFVRMVAGERIWAHEGSMIAISQALKIKLITFTIIDSKIATIIESGPGNDDGDTNSSNFLTIFNIDNAHFYAAECKNNSYNIPNIRNDFEKSIPFMRFELFQLYRTF